MTFEVSKFDTFKYFYDLHPENIYFIFVTEWVLKLDKSKDIIFEQLRNI